MAPSSIAPHSQETSAASLKPFAPTHVRSEKIQQIYIHEEYVDMQASGVIEFASTYVVATDTTPVGDDARKTGIDEAESSSPGRQVSEDDMNTEDGPERESDGNTVIPDDGFQAKLEAEDDNISSASDSSISFSSSLSNLSPTPFVRSPSPSPEINVAVDPFETAIGKLVLAKTLAGITYDSDIEPKMYEELVSELLTIFKKSNDSFVSFDWDVY